MNGTSQFPGLVERFFLQRLIQERGVSPHTIASYRDTFRLLLDFAQRRLHKHACDLSIPELDAQLIVQFLNELEVTRAASASTRNLRLTAIRSFFRFVAAERPEYLAATQRILAIPSKRRAKPEVAYMTHAECQALLAVPDVTTWIGRRDRMLLLLAVQSGLRLSELISLDRQSVVPGPGAHVRCHGKGRKDRCTPLTREVVRELSAWLKEPTRGTCDALFPTVHGQRMSADTIQRLLAKHVSTARTQCPSLNHKRITPHTLRHSAAMELLQAGVDTSVIALYLGHESVDSTQRYLHAHIALKEAALAKTTPLDVAPARFRPGDRLLHFLSTL